MAVKVTIHCLLVILYLLFKFNFNIAVCHCNKGVQYGKTCDSTGKCDCKLNFAGVKCDKCAVGYDDFHNGCKAGKLVFRISTLLVRFRENVSEYCK